MNVAEYFALKDLPEDKCAIVYHIEFKGDEGLFYLSDDNYTAFEEQEVLIQDGLDYTITNVSEYYTQTDGQKVTRIQLVYPPR